MHKLHGQLINDEPSKLELSCSSGRKNLSLAKKYENKLNSLTLEELQDLAEEVGLIPIDNRDFLIKSLKKELKES